MDTADNPLLADSELPAFSAIAPEHVNPAVDAVLAEFRAAVERLVADPQARGFATLMAPLERLEERLGRVWAPVSHLHGVKDSPALREAYNAALEKLTEHSTELGQNRDLYAAVKALAESPEFAALDRARRTLVEDSLRSFRLSGVALEEPARSRFRAIQNELSKLETEFEEAVLDATDAWARPLSEAELAGLPDSARAIFRQAAQERGVEGYLATLKGPSVQAILTFADDRALRRELYTAYNTRASDQGPHGGRFDNSARIEKILALRHEAARLLDYPSAAHVSLADKMAGTPERVLAFLHDLAARAKPVAARELDALRDFARAELGYDELQPWDIAYASEKLRQRRFDFSEEDLKPYFPLPAVIDGLFAIAGRVFGVSFRARDGVDVWHPDVRYFDVVDADGTVRAGFYTDLHARTGKRGGAWMDVCRARFHDGELHRPVAFLTCNFAPPVDGKPALLTHDDVLTLFHEFGHGLHHMLTEVDWPSVGGISGVEWDAVELPSQFMENFCWQRETLGLFARHYQTGAPLPDELHAKMLAARHFQAGLFLVRQLEFALFDFRLHLEFDPARGGRVLEILDEVRREVAVVRPPEWHRFPHAFTHIFSGGYAAGYYSYLWAEVLSADAFAAFEEAGVFDHATGARFRREILAVGGSRPALESFVAFRGREPSPEALLRSYGLAA
ncbi:M3 family metallopeptidase [Rehaibacterium terrae]|jgi:oligopeptidase A|uniref:oligopeptidase A n=1 Tax=Rehaibacterium terrae TaxID=1341696 RepID=A0A7W7V6L0_9GAMM|nr:M3 family metallopeptidase [Rehaibacterium terrae]MBB5014202.1 oligopeptidase A [Rehaibacterium terrae]